MIVDDMKSAIGEAHNEKAEQGQTDVGGLFDGFEAYRTPTDTDYRRLLTEGVVVPDANVFLNLYRYNEQTRNDLLAVLRELGERLWVPNQVIVEFWRNREAILQDPRATTATIKDLDGLKDRAIGIVRAWSNRVNLSQQRNDELCKVVLDAFEAVSDGVQELADNAATDFARDTNKDPVLQQLVPIVDGRIGPAFDKAGLGAAVSEAKSRIDSKIPPGFRDAAKDPDLAAGDYLIWLQTIHRARSTKRDVLFVTGDVKEDWWRREHGELRGPLPALVNEMWEQASVRLYMLRTESMILHARKTFQIDISDESVEDIGRIDQLASTLDQGDSASFEYILAMWPEIIEEVHERRKVAWLLLSNATPLAIDADALTVQFARDGDARAFISASCDTNLSEVLAELTGLTRRIRAASVQGSMYEVEDKKPTSVTPGEILLHDSYGIGRVISFQSATGDPAARVKFGKDHGTKLLTLRYAPVRRIIGWRD